MADVVEVDPEALRDLSRSFFRVANHVIGVEFTSNEHDSGLGSGRVAGALRDFTDSWGDTRNRLLDDLFEAAEYVMTVAVEIRQTDRLLVAAFQDEAPAADAG